MIKRLLTGAACACTTCASAQTFLSEYNLVVENNLLLSTSEVDGSAIIGGAIVGGASNYSTQAVTASDNTGLAVGDSIAPGVAVNINNGGDFRISNTASNFGTVNLNGGSTIQDTGIAARAASYANQARYYSGILSALPVNGTVDAGGNMSALSPNVIDGFALAVFDLSQSQFDSGLGQLNLDFNNADNVVINYSTGGTGIADLTSPPNIIGDFNQANSGRIIWNFVDATEVIIGNSFNGAILAPDAALTVNSGGINGSVIVNSLELQNAEIRLRLYDGYVPAPASASLIGLAGLASVRRRR